MCIIASISLHQKWGVVARWRSSEHCGRNVTVKSVISSLILVHLDCQTEPGFWVSIGWPSNGHASERHQDSMVQPSVELDYNGLWVGVLSITYEVPELIQVGIDCSVTLEVVHHLESIDSSSFSIKGQEVLLELFFKVEPVKEMKSSFACFSLELVHCPASSMTSVHIGHSPDDFNKIIIERFRSEPNICSARREKCLTSRVFTIKIQWWRRFKGYLLPTSGSGYRWGIVKQSLHI